MPFRYEYFFTENRQLQTNIQNIVNVMEGAKIEWFARLPCEVAKKITGF